MYWNNLGDLIKPTNCSNFRVYDFVTLEWDPRNYTSDKFSINNDIAGSKTHFEDLCFGGRYQKKQSMMKRTLFKKT